MCATSEKALSFLPAKLSGVGAHKKSSSAAQGVVSYIWREVVFGTLVLGHLGLSIALENWQQVQLA